MVVHAHPDDEVFSTGGSIAKYAEAGVRVVVVYATNGEAGEMHDPDLDPDDALARMGEIRRDEVRRACAVLGTRDLYFLDYRDSGMKDTEDNKNPAAFMNAPLDEAVERLMAVMRETRPGVVVTYDESGGYGHPDHIMTNRVTTAAFERARTHVWGPRKLYYAARSREGFRRYAGALQRLGLQIPWLKDDFDFDAYGIPDAEITAHIDVARYVPRKKQALAVHRTQIRSDHFYLSIPDEVLREASDTEVFVRVFPPPLPGEREDDLFAGVAVDSEAVA